MNKYIMSAVLIAFLTSITGAMAQSRVIDVRGSNMQTTRPFTVRDGWEIQWESAGAYFQIAVKNDQGEVVDIAANQSDGSSGSTYMAVGGRFYLEILASQQWRVRVVQARQR